MKNPFKIEMAENKAMGAWEVILQVGGLKTKQEAEDSAKILAEFMAGENGWTKRVQ